MTGRSWHGTLVFCGAVLLTACVNPADPVVPVADDELHGLMTTRIADLWSQIEVLDFDPHRTALDLDTERRRKAVDIARSASGLQEAARAILDIKPQLNLDPQQGNRFSELANQLLADGATLQALAQGNQFDEIGAAVQRTMETCNTCHRLYRNP